MKRFLKIFIILIVSLIIYIFVDLLFGVFFGKPLIAIESKEEYKYKGIFFDTYDCPEYSITLIKSKFSDFSCKIKKHILKEIVDKTKEKDDFSCAEALEEFYKDEKYTYYYSCMKSKYVIARYEDGYEETVKEALRYKRITIADLDRYDIQYYKYDK